MSHTPGPWEMEPGEPEMREGWSIGAPGSPHPLGKEYTREDNVVGSCCSAGVYREEDARLICAAPAMFDALQKILNARASGCTTGEAMSKAECWAREALALAQKR